MNKKGLSLFLIVIIGITGFGLYFMVNNPNNVPTEDYIGDVSISEIYYNADVFQNDFIELYIWDNESLDLTDWVLRDYDGWETKLPTIVNLKVFTHIAVYLGQGTNDLDASDLSAKIYLGLSNDVLDNSDEVGLYDNYGRLIDFVKYNGGNSNVNYGNWSSSDSGPVAKSGESIQLFGNDTDSSVNWISSVPTPADANMITFNTGTGIDVEIYNGIYDTAPSGYSEKPSYRDVPPYTVTGHGVNASVLRMIKEQINFTINYYKSLGFPSPITTSDGKIIFKVITNRRDGTTGSSDDGANVKIKVGRKANKYELKVCVEHEIMHLVQWHKSKNSAGDNINNMPHPYSSNNWFEEGMAEYWGRRSAMKNYNKSMKFIVDQLKKVKTANWYDHARDTNISTFSKWGRTWNDYEMAFQFIKFLVEKYGQEIVKQIQASAENNLSNSTKSISCKQALEKVLGKSMNDILAEFYKWKLVNRENGDIPPPKIHYNNTIGNTSDGFYVGVTYNESAPKGGALIQTVLANTSDAVNFTVYVNKGHWHVVFIEIRKDGTNRTYTVASNGKDVSHKFDGKLVKKLIVIKMRDVNDTSTGQINITITDLYGTIENPKPLKPGKTAYCQLPYSETSPSMWFNVTFPENHIFHGELFGPENTNFSLRVYTPDMHLLMDSFDFTPSGTYPQIVEFNSTFAPFYYLEAAPVFGSGEFNLTVYDETPPLTNVDIKSTDLSLKQITKIGLETINSLQIRSLEIQIPVNYAILNINALLFGNIFY